MPGSLFVGSCRDMQPKKSLPNSQEQLHDISPAFDDFRRMRFCFSFRHECVRLKHFVTHSQLLDNTVTNCGMDNPNGPNGEAVYIGTSSKQVMMHAPTSRIESHRIECILHLQMATRVEDNQVDINCSTVQSVSRGTALRLASQINVGVSR